jgi:lipopolysaccharide export system permease protein
MIFERAARREFAQTAAGISVALLAILISTQLIRLLKDAAVGRIVPEAIASLLGFATLNFMPIVLSLTLFVSILLSLSRAYRDSEMVIWFTSGQPLTAWMRPVLRFAFPIVGAIAALTWFLTPWANYSRDEYKQKLSARSELAQVSPGTFQEASGGRRVLFVEALAEDASTVGNVFVASVQDGKLGVVMSDTGHQRLAGNGDRFVVLESGRRYEVKPGTPEFKVMEFERYQVRIEDGEARPVEHSVRTMSMLELVLDGSENARGELVWRIGIPLMALVLALLAIPLGFVNPRAGRSANLLIAIPIYAIYSNLLSISETAVAQGRLSFWIGLWAVHGLMLLPLLVLFFQRMSVGNPLLRWRR